MFPEAQMPPAIRCRNLHSPVGERFEVHGRRRHGLPGALLLGVGVEAVGQVAAGGEVESHDAVVRLQQPRVHGEVGGRATGSCKGKRQKKHAMLRLVLRTIVIETKITRELYTTSFVLVLVCSHHCRRGQKHAKIYTASTAVNKNTR